MANGSKFILPWIVLVAVLVKNKIKTKSIVGTIYRGFPVGSAVKNLSPNIGGVHWIPRFG